MQKRVLKDDYINDKILEDKTLEQIKGEYNFTEMKDTFNDVKIPPQLEFVNNLNLVITIIFYRRGIFCV